jgi:DNA-binding ferritin-like protein (Dps family)
MSMSDYFNIKKMRKDKKEYQEMMTRVKALPKANQFWI